MRERIAAAGSTLDARVLDGAGATRRLRVQPASPPVLILTTFDDDETVAAALGAGAAGFILKDARGEDNVRATTIVAEGGSWLDHRDLRMFEQLTPRELDVPRHVGQGLTNSEIAAALYVSEATAKTHLGNLLSKLDLRDRAAAIIFDHNSGLV